MSQLERCRILVVGYIVGGPLGGLVWHHLQYVMGLARLGHDVYFIEDSHDYPSCYDPERNTMDRDPSYGLKFTERIFRELGLEDRWAYYDAHTAQWFGPCAGRALELCRTADMLLNMSGKTVLRPWFMEVPAKILVDTDPVFTQVRHLTDEAAHQQGSAHTAFFTFGENFGTDGASVPDDGFPWQPTRQPVVLDAWPVTPGPRSGRYSSVLNWESYAGCEFGGRTFEMKSASFMPFMQLPEKSGARLELAVGSKDAPRRTMRRNGWSILDPREPTRTPWTYQDYIRQSKGEFGIAKHGYVVTRSGWFSERSAAYLASGRPVVVQETGFSDWLDADMGVRSFNTPEEAVAALEDVDSAYEAHCRAAREVAAEYFDYRKVLASLIARAIG